MSKKICENQVSICVNKKKNFQWPSQYIFSGEIMMHKCRETEGAERMREDRE